MPFIPEGSHDASQALSFKFPGFALIIVILLAFQCRKFLSLWDTINRHQPFSLWLNFQLCTLQLYLSSLLKNQWLALFPLMLNCNCLPWLGQSYFLLIVFGFFFGSACFGPSVFIVCSACFVSSFSLPVHIYPFHLSRFPCSGRILYSWLYLLFCTPLFCFVPCPLFASFSFIALYICCALCVYFFRGGL